jgi:hypothetical protein
MMRFVFAAALLGAAAVVSAGAAGAAEIAGAIDANGQRQVKSSLYTVGHPSTGRYVIKFKQAFPAPYATCLFMPIGSYHPNGLVETTTSCDVTFTNEAGKLSNVLFNFLAVTTTD